LEVGVRGKGESVGRGRWGLRLSLRSALILLSAPILLTATSSWCQTAPPSGVSAANSQPAGAEVAPPSDFRALDQPNDNGHGVVLHWRLSPDDATILGYEIARAPQPGAPESDWVVVGMAPRGADSYTYRADEPELNGAANPLYIVPGRPIEVHLRARTLDGRVSPWAPAASAVPKGDWYDTTKTNVLIAVILFGLATIFFIQQGKKGKELYIRPIPGISAVDEAIGRATEMGRPILFVLGMGGAGDIATIAGYTILARVARRTAEYQTAILVPVQDPVVMVMAQETVKEAYLQAGRPDVYRPESIYYIAAMQFPYVAAVNGLMVREKTATNFYMGVFYAESLLLAEAGSVSGAIQISGTDQVSQIPFFVAATDYTLIGEELYAASAYLSQDPVLLGPLKAQDWTKIIILVLVIVSVILLTATGHDWLAPLVHAS
jgi:hypothetical protein